MKAKKNKYIIRSRISEAKFRQIILLFSEDLSATQTFHLTRLSRQTINKYLTAIRLRILETSQLQSAPLVGQIEVDFELIIQKFLFLQVSKFY